MNPHQTLFWLSQRKYDRNIYEPQNVVNPQVFHMENVCDQTVYHMFRRI